jgi:hypothetical protein
VPTLSAPWLARSRVRSIAGYSQGSEAVAAIFCALGTQRLVIDFRNDVRTAENFIDGA